MAKRQTPEERNAAFVHTAVTMLVREILALVPADGQIYRCAISFSHGWDRDGRLRVGFNVVTPADITKLKLLKWREPDQ